ncbi:hypothetical protein [Nocardia sp. BMG51109]|uniref:hypothetical protein n=1 Tax=Nocardia sp. BMG51109 TaxID=1056816 RepID=UPI0004B4F68E|nr:hypothetical protein [Nocardia sp. BMG51109]
MTDYNPRHLRKHSNGMRKDTLIRTTRETMVAGTACASASWFVGPDTIIRVCAYTDRGGTLHKVRPATPLPEMVDTHTDLEALWLKVLMHRDEELFPPPTAEIDHKALNRLLRGKEVKDYGTQRKRG